MDSADRSSLTRSTSIEFSMASSGRVLRSSPDKSSLLEDYIHRPLLQYGNHVIRQTMPDEEEMMPTQPLTMEAKLDAFENDVFLRGLELDAVIREMRVWSKSPDGQNLTADDGKKLASIPDTFKKWTDTNAIAKGKVLSILKRLQKW